MLLRRHKAAQEEPTVEAASKKTGKTKKKDEADE